MFSHLTGYGKQPQEDSGWPSGFYGEVGALLGTVTTLRTQSLVCVRVPKNPIRDLH